MSPRPPRIPKPDPEDFADFLLKGKYAPAERTWEGYRAKYGLNYEDLTKLAGLPGEEGPLHRFIREYVKLALANQKNAGADSSARDATCATLITVLQEMIRPPSDDDKRAKAFLSSLTTSLDADMRKFQGKKR